MATAVYRAQEVITCELCENSTKQFCNSCQVRLCVDCVSKHVNMVTSLPHDIVLFQNRKLQLTFDECQIHLDEKCLLHCRTCDIPVCVMCIVGPHKTHSLERAAEIFEGKKREIEKDNETIKTDFIETLKKKSEFVEKQIQTMFTKYSSLEDEIEKERKTWHRGVDTIFDRVDTVVYSQREKDVALLVTHQDIINNAISDFENKLRQNVDLLKSTKVSAVNSYTSNLITKKQTHADVYANIPVLKKNSKDDDGLSIEIGGSKYCLTQTLMNSSLIQRPLQTPSKTLLTEVEMISSISTKLKDLRSVACVGTDEAWISSQDCVNEIMRYNISGFLLKMDMRKCVVTDITVNRLLKELIFTDGASKTINVFNNLGVERLAKISKGWYPKGVCLMSSGDILVSLESTDEMHNKIVQYRDGVVTAEIYKDTNGKCIYKAGKHMLYVAENNNGDICASDQNAGQVVVVTNFGEVRFRYDGKAAKRAESFSLFKIGKRKAFDPQDIVTDCVGYIIVADSENHCIHVLDQNGQFLKCLDGPGMVNPGGLCIDEVGRLWVASKTSGDVKILKYMS